MRNIVLAWASTPFSAAYEFQYGGWGSNGYNSGSALAGAGNGVAISENGAYCAFANNSTPFCKLFTYTPINTYRSGNNQFGTAYSAPSPLPPGTGQAVAMTVAADAIAIATQTSPYRATYKLSSGWGTKYTNGTNPPGNCYGVAFNRAGTLIGYSSTASAYIAVYAWTQASGEGTKYVDPGTLPAATGYGIAFSPDGNYVALALGSSPYQAVYPVSGGVFGTKVVAGSNPAGQCNGVAFSYDGSTISFAVNSSPYVATYPWSGGAYGTKWTAPGTSPTGAAHGVAFSKIGDILAFAHSTSPYTTAYNIASGAYTSKVANPAVITSVANGIAVYDDSGSGTVTITNPGFYAWQAASTGTIAIQAWAPGGGGDSYDNTLYGGGGGAYSKLNSASVTSGNYYPIYVGFQGLGGYNSATDGEDSFGISVTTLLAKAGYSAIDGTHPGLGGSAANGYGDVKYSGGSGFGSIGGGGGGAGSGGNGSDSVVTGGTGGTPDGGTGGSGGFGLGLNGTAGSTFGGGGGSGDVSPNVGGAGGAGQTIITFTAGGGGTFIYNAQVISNVAVQFASSW